MTWMKRQSKLINILSDYLTACHQFFHLFTDSQRLYINAHSGKLAGAFFLVIILSSFCGYQLACIQTSKIHQEISGEWQQHLAHDRHQIKHLELKAQQDLEILTQHIGRLEANLMRINALGEKLVQMADIDSQEFDFSQEVGMGGPDIRQLSNDSVLTSIRSLSVQFDKRLAQLSALQQAYQFRFGQKELSFSGPGKIVEKGWISSYFGHRHDPFTGRKVFHGGVDIVGKEGSEIKALASGVVSFANRKGAYGQLVEINHGNGISTRYGHNKKLLVHAGQIVRKGQAIALLGSTGRSTGPHLHLEVRKDGQAVDPGLYFADLKQKARSKT